MNRRVGKDIDMRLLRSKEDEKQANEKCKMMCEKYFSSANQMAKKCRICGSEHTHDFFNAYYGYKYLKCKDCGALFLGNIPNLDKMYKNSGDNAVYYVDDARFEERVKSIAAPKVDYVLDVCGKSNVHSWVDIGSGGGQILSYVKKIKIEAIGIESDDSEVQFCIKKGLKVIRGFLNPDNDNEEIKNALRNADVISAFCVLEHIEKPKAVIDYLADNMKSGAVLVIEVPRYPSVSMYACMLNKDVVYRYITLPEHLQIFSDNSIEYCFKNNFSLIGTWGFGQGFSDLINHPSLYMEDDNVELYDAIMGCSNDIQLIFDKAGLSDRMIYIGRRI